MRIRRLGLLAVIICFQIPQACAQGYPNKPVRIIVPFSPGGSVDGLARVIGSKLSERLHQPFVVESRPGGGGTIGADVVAKSPPDGYTILHNTVGQAIAPAIFKTLPFDTIKDFTPVTQVVSSTLVLVATPSLPARSISELVALAKAKPTRLNYGMTGIGGPLQLTMEMFKHATSIEVQSVPYRGDSNIMAALVSGEIHLAVVAMALATPLVESGQIRALGIAGPTRIPIMPDVPTIGETVPGFVATSWQAFWMPANTPKDVVETIQDEVARALTLPDVQERLKGWSNEPVGSRPEVFDAFFRAEVAKYIKVAKDANLQQQ